MSGSGKAEREGPVSLILTDRAGREVTPAPRVESPADLSAGFSATEHTFGFGEEKVLIAHRGASKPRQERGLPSPLLLGWRLWHKMPQFAQISQPLLQVLPWKRHVSGLQSSDFGLSGHFGGEADSWSFLL